MSIAACSAAVQRDDSGTAGAVCYLYMFTARSKGRWLQVLHSPQHEVGSYSLYGGLRVCCRYHPPRVPMRTLLDNLRGGGEWQFHAAMTYARRQSAWATAALCEMAWVAATSWATSLQRHDWRWHLRHRCSPRASPGFTLRARFPHGGKEGVHEHRCPAQARPGRFGWGLFRALGEPAWVRVVSAQGWLALACCCRSMVQFCLGLCAGPHISRHGYLNAYPGGGGGGG